MNNNDSIPMAIITGMVIGMLLTIVMYEYSPNSIVVKADSAIELCEQDLPRTQRCIITAIPEEK